MTQPFVYEVDGAGYLDRQKRMRELIGRIHTGESFDVEELTKAIGRIQREVDPIPLVIGVTYRWRLLEASGAIHHHHVRDEAGEVHGLALPVLDDASFAEMQGTFLGRQGMTPGAAALLLFNVAGQPVGLGDMDILRIEEIR